MYFTYRALLQSLQQLFLNGVIQAGGNQCFFLSKINQFSYSSTQTYIHNHIQCIRFHAHINFFGGTALLFQAMLLHSESDCSSIIRGHYASGYGQRIIFLRVPYHTQGSHCNDIIKIQDFFSTFQDPLTSENHDLVYV